MSGRANVRTIARTELRRRWRALADDTTQVIAIAFVGLVFVPFSLLGPVGAFLLGSELRAGDAATALEWSRAALVYAWIVATLFLAYRGYATALRPDRLDGLLTTVSHRELLGGLVLAEALLWGVPATLYGAVVALSFAVGAGSIPALSTVFVAIVATLSTALAAGVGLALAVRNAGVRSTLLVRLRTLLLSLLGVGYFWLLVTGSFGAVFDPLRWLLEPTPVGWFGDLALLGTAPDASLARGVGAAVASVAFLAGCAVALPRLAAWLWYADGVHVEREATAAATDDGGPRLEGVLPRPVVGVVATDWKRARRAPIALSFVLYPLIVLVNPIATVVQTGTVGSSFPLWIALCGAWITGAAFTLNVVGNEGAVLPATLLSESPGRALVGGHAVAGALLGLPVTVLAVVGLGLASPHPSAAVATLAASAAVLCACAGPIAAGVGAVFPRFESVSVSRSTEAIVPSKLAFAAYSLALVAAALPTLLAHGSIVGGTVASLAGVSRATVALVGTGTTALLAAGAAVVSARYAVGAVETYRFD